MSKAVSALATDTIYVVIRSQGEYSDRSETAVCWFPDLASAENFVERATPESRAAAAKWKDIERDSEIDRYADDGRYEQYVARLGLLDKTFDPGAYDADYASYFISEVKRGSAPHVER